MQIKAALLAVALTAGPLTLAGQNLAPNLSFELGQTAPDSWTLQGCAGRWEEAGHTGNRCLSVTGTGKDSGAWLSSACKVEPGQLYLVRFWTLHTNASGGTPVTGFDVVNQDIGMVPGWRQCAFITALPARPAQPSLRFGQWMVNGTVLFDDLEVLAVAPVHAQRGEIRLGRGERIRNGRYSFESNLGGYAGNHSRCLHEHTAGFNSDRWVLGAPPSPANPASGPYVVYRHVIPGHAFTSATVKAVVGYYQNGECILDASPDGRTWQELGRGKPKGAASGGFTVEVPVPASLLPAPSLFVRVRAGGSLQVNACQLQGTLAGNPPDLEGQTWYFEPERSSAQVDVSWLGAGQTVGGRRLSLKLRNTAATPQELRLVCRSSRGPVTVSASQSVQLPAAEAREVEVALASAGAGENLVRLSVEDAGGQALYAAAARMNVSFLQDNSFGHRLPGGENCALWWCEGTYKVGRERGLPAAAGAAIEIAAARHEYEPFQLVLQPPQPLLNARFEVSDLTGPGASVISSSNVEICRVEYVPVTRPTDAAGSTGDHPDPLVPVTGSFEVAARRNQPFWFTVYVPKDAAAGRYQGTITLHTGSGTPLTVPLRLRVFNFTLPEETHTQTAYGVSIENGWHRLNTPDQFKQAWDLYMQNCRRHRISPYTPQTYADIKWTLKDGEFTHNFTNFDAAMTRYLDDFKFNAFNLAIVPSELGGHKQFTPEYRALYAKLMGPIVSHLRQRGWLEKAYCYWFDEPEERQYPYVIEGMKTIKAGAPGLRRLLTEQPEPPLYDHVDLWSPIFDQYNASRCQARQAAGSEVWWYVCCGPHAPYPNNFIDHPALNHRIRNWMAEKLGVTGELYWSVTYYRREQNKLRNPWEEAMSVNPEGGTWGNGDGMLLYPPVKTPPTEPVLRGPLNSIRWEMLREGLEDGEYFWLLKQALAKAKTGPEAAAGQTALKEALALITSQTEFEKDPQKLYAARLRVAEAIIRLNR